jgi:uncharacterized protein (TIGR02611 family)
MDEPETLETALDRWEGEGGALGGSRQPSEISRRPASRSPALGVLRFSRKVGVAVAGGSVLLVGIALIFLPGPAIVVIPLGLALLATEFRWAARLLAYLRAQGARAVHRARRAVARPART